MDATQQAPEEVIRVRLEALEAEKDAAQASLDHFFGEVLPAVGVLAPADLQSVLSEFLVPAWRTLGRYETLGVIREKELFSPVELEECLADTRQEAVTRGHDVLRLRDRWKSGAYPKARGELVVALQGILAPLYRAVGADLEIEEVYLDLFGSPAPQAGEFVPERPY